MRKLILILAAVPVWVCAATADYVINNENSQIYGIIDADEETEWFSCRSGRGFLSLNDGLSGGTWNGRTVEMEFNDPLSGPVPLDTSASWTSDTGLVPWAATAKADVRFNINGAGAKLSYWVMCGN